MTSNSFNHKLLITIFLLNMVKLSYSQISQQLNTIQESVYSIMIVNIQDQIDKKEMVDTKNATAFSFKYKDRIYLACAKHSVEEYYKNKSVILFSVAINKETTIYQRGIVYFDDSYADVALIKPLEFPGLPLIEYYSNTELNSSDLPLLSQLYLFGYPTFNTGKMISVFRSINENGVFSSFVKKGTISGYDKSDMNNNKYFLDVALSKGYSGGPAYYINPSGETYIVGVITGTTISNILNKDYQLIGDLYQNGDLSVITNSKHLLTILEKME